LAYPPLLSGFFPSRPPMINERPAPPGRGEPRERRRPNTPTTSDNDNSLLSDTHKEEEGLPKVWKSVD